MFKTNFELSLFMGQQEVYNFLKDHPNDWFTSRDISKGINISVGSVTVSLKRLREKNEVQYKSGGKRYERKKQYLYKFKPAVGGEFRWF